MLCVLTYTFYKIMANFLGKDVPTVMTMAEGSFVKDGASSVAMNAVDVGR